MATESDDDVSFESADEEEKPSNESITEEKAQDNETKDITNIASLPAGDNEQLTPSTGVGDESQPCDNLTSNQSESSTTATGQAEPEPTNVSDTAVSSKTVLKCETKEAEVEGQSSGGSGWGWNSLSSWGTSVLNTATSSVTTFTKEVGEGLYQVLESVDSGFQAPTNSDNDNDSSATENKDDDENKDQSVESDVHVAKDTVVTHQIEKSRGIESEGINQSQKTCKETAGEGGGGGWAEAGGGAEDGDDWFASWGLPVGLSDVVHKTTNVVHQTVQQTTSVSQKVLSSGLDVLETIGKKTFDILTEGDHGLKKTIERNRANTPNLSKSLREAKEIAERRAAEESEFLESRKSHYGAQFDDYQGLVQLEALEMLSTCNEERLKRLLDVLLRGSDEEEEVSESLRPRLIEIKTIFEETDVDNEDVDDTAHDFQKLVLDYKGTLPVNASVQKLLTTQATTQLWLDDFGQSLLSETPRTSKEIHQRSVQSLAELTAYSIEHFHRVGQLILQDNVMTPASYQELAFSLSKLTKTLCAEVGLTSARFVQCLVKLGSASGDSITEIVTSIYLESNNSSRYIQNGFQLLLPIVQLATIRSNPMCKKLIDVAS